MKDLKERAIRGGLARSGAQAIYFIIRLGSVMVLGRLLGPEDFGLVGMVTAFTGVLDLCRDFGLSAATVQWTTITEEQVSTLFWINILFGTLLGLIMAAIAPAIASFYHEPRLLAVTLVLAAGFLFNAAGVQHSALLQREMRFTTLAAVGVISMILGTAVAIGGAEAGYGYWALVAMSVTLPLTATIGYWLTSRWIPGMPRRRTGIRSMMRFGGALTFNGLVVYIASNFEKILLGRFWGAAAIGFYGRAFQLISIPTSNLNSAAGEVAFSALSRLQGDPDRRKRYFLKGYSLLLALTLPITIAGALFADDVIVVLLGPKWKDAAPIFRLLSPTILVFATANPLGWLLCAGGLIRRLLKMSLVIAPIMIFGYGLALPYGPKGVAFTYSLIMSVWLVPLIAWAVRGTEISFWDIVRTAMAPLASSVAAGGLALGVGLSFAQHWSPLARLTLESLALLITFVALLLFAAGQKSFYLEVFRGLTRTSSSKGKVLASA